MKGISELPKEYATTNQAFLWRPGWARNWDNIVSTLPHDFFLFTIQTPTSVHTLVINQLVLTKIDG